MKKLEPMTDSLSNYTCFGYVIPESCVNHRYLEWLPQAYFIFIQGRLTSFPQYELEIEEISDNVNDDSNPHKNDNIPYS